MAHCQSKRRSKKDFPDLTRENRAWSGRRGSIIKPHVHTAMELSDLLRKILSVRSVSISSSPGFLSSRLDLYLSLGATSCLEALSLSTWVLGSTPPCFSIMPIFRESHTPTRALHLTTLKRWSSLDHNQVARSPSTELNPHKHTMSLKSSRYLYVSNTATPANHPAPSNSRHLLAGKCTLTTQQPSCTHYTPAPNTDKHHRDPQLSSTEIIFYQPLKPQKSCKTVDRQLPGSLRRS